MFKNQKPAFFLLILCSLSLFALAFDPRVQKSYFSVAPNSSFSYEFPQTHNGTYAHFFDKSGPSSRYILFNLTSGDAYTVLENTVTACQVASPIFQHIQYHVQTDNLVYYCAANASLLFIDQGSQIVSTAIPLNLNGTWPIAKLSTDGMSISILAMDNLFTANPQSSILVKVDMQSKQVASQILFNQNLTSGEAVVVYAPGSKTSYIATNRIQDNNVITKIYTIAIIGTTYQITPLANLVDLTSSAKTITKLFAMGNYIVVNCDTTLYFLNNLGMMVQLANIRTKELTPGIFHPAVVRSTDGGSLYLHINTFEAMTYTIVASGIFTKSLGDTQDILIAHANQTSNDLMFTYDHSGVFFNILDLKTKETVRTAISGPANDLMLTNTTYTLVRTLDSTTNVFYIFDLETDYLVRVSILSTKYYYNKDQHIVTSLNPPIDSSCQVAHLDLVSGQYWKSLSFSSSSDACSGYVSYARITEKGNPELVIPTNQSYLIISETYGQITFNTNSLTHDADSINVNFDDLSFYYYTSNQVLKQINASLYTFNPQSQSFQLNSTKLLNLRPVGSHGFFTIDQNLTVALSDSTFTLINQLNSQWYKVYFNNFNSVTGFEDVYGTPYVFFSYVSESSQYPKDSAPMIYANYGDTVWIPGSRASTVSGQATGPSSFALYDLIYSSVGVVRFFNSDPQSSKTLISI